MTDVIGHARAAIARGSKSFALASKLFDPVTRDRAMLLYAWCRHTDDVIDGQILGQGRNDDQRPPAERLAEVERLTEMALADQPTGVPAYDALAQVVRETGMPPQYPRDLVEGFRIDMEERPFRTFDDTLAYCYHVAGCVGVMMAIVMGVSPDDEPTLDRACDLGIAFQLNNIARDVVEDAMNGRRYIPDDWLASVDLLPNSFAFPANRRQLARLVARLVFAAETYEASAQFGTPALSRRAAWAVLAAARIYGGIGRKVRDAGADGLEHRMSTSKAEKLQAVSVAFAETLTRARRWPLPGPPRDGLWTRPR
ncbi:phytoene/squalene synthase family protein [Polymorphobacter fuscus]|uniref:phytoene/squalene synthase family protein n=1 Tax=Sandarakinorhabdus fusca TaxID=1439888 RepID=UPI0016AAD9B9|nr:phytoene/squalene synthase family protein [Polymorphobacter fuscus]NJC08033.1 phytoene synthase [Polymorphobacter fuscus]